MGEPGGDPADRDVRTIELGQFEDANADLIEAELRDAGIVCWSKRPGGLTRFVFAGDWGTRLYVDRRRRQEAERIAERVLDA